MHGYGRGTFRGAMLHLGSIGGTSIDVDFNFIFLVLFFVVLNYNPEQGLHYALLWIPVLFLSVLIHELAHAGTIALFGFGASQIVLTGMGGVTMNRRRARPWQDLIISVAGPLSSFGLWLLCTWLYFNVPLVRSDRMLIALVPLLGAANWWWGLFNLIPISPLDGGHATRDFFRMFTSERTSFIIAVWIGIIVGGAVIAWSLKARQFFVALFIAFLVYRAYEQWRYFREHGVPGD
jgi:Zn-dependent protease